MTKSEFVTKTFETETGSIEVETYPGNNDGSLVPASALGEKTIQKLEDVFASIAPAIGKINDKLNEICPDEIELKFGVKISQSATAIIAGCSGEANFEVKMVWKKN